MRSVVITALGGAILLFAGSAGASPQDGRASVLAGRPALLDSLLACRALVGADERLACFDRAAAAFDAAERGGEVTVIDRALARETRTRLFGLNLGSANLFGGLRPEAPVEAVETTLVRASQGQNGKWVLVLEDGSTWRQVDTSRLAPRPAPGQRVRIRQAAIGSYLLSVGSGRSIRARREN